MHKTYSLTVNILLDRPTLAVNSGDALVATEANPAEVEQGQMLTFSSQTFAKVVTLPAGRNGQAAGSTITDVTATSATTAPAIGGVLKLSDGAGSAYQIDSALLAADHTYRINTVTTGFDAKANPSAAPSTTTQYFIKIIEPEDQPGNEDVLRFDGKVDIDKGTRYDTMKDIVVNGGAFTSANTNILIFASGDNFPDALAASGFAGLLQAPVVYIHGAMGWQGGRGNGTGQGDGVIWSCTNTSGTPARPSPYPNQFKMSIPDLKDAHL